VSQITTCPHCSKRLRVSEQITAKTLICPHCLVEVNNPQPGIHIRVADIDTDVKRDLKGGCIALALLIGLCVCGIVMATRFAYLVWLGVIPVLVLSGIILLAWKGTSGSTASTAGRVVSVLFIVLGTIAALVIFVFAACAIAIGNMQFGR
jgi:hypothetical protein